MCKVTAFFLLGLVALTWGFPTEENVATGRIYGGTEAGRFDATFMVSVRVDIDTHICGGALITTRNVVVAASCIFQRHERNVRVVVGANTLNMGEGAAYNSSRLRLYPTFDSLTRRDDIGLITTETKVVLGLRVTLVPMRSTIVENVESATVFGWGNVRNPGSVVNHLQKLETKTIALAACQAAMVNINLPVVTNHICTFIGVGEGICDGDIGGPLVANNRELIGVATWSVRIEGRCAVGYPDVFTRISSYYDWIMNNSILDDDHKE